MKKSGDRLTPAVSPVKTNNHLEIERAYKKAQSAAQGLTRAFGQDSMFYPPPIDAIISERLHAALDSISDDLISACLQRGILPSYMVDTLIMASFLSCTLPLARGAQASTQVPASVLIAEAFHISGTDFYSGRFELEGAKSHDVFKAGKRFASIRESFEYRAEQLKKDAKFKPVLESTGDYAIGLTSPVYTPDFIDQVGIWSAPKYGKDLVNTITSYDLIECDRMLPIK
jgi:hypothetical protein